MANADRKPTRDADGSILKKIEERRTARGKVRKETVYYARVRMNEYDASGNFVRSHERKRRADSYDDAVIKRRSLRLELQADIEKARLKANLPREHFFDLLDFYENHFVKPAVFSNGKKIAGQRTPIGITRLMIRTAREFFGNVPVSEITYARIFDYKLALAATRYKIVRKVKIPKLDPKERQRFTMTEEWRDRKPATVHRYLACLRRILYVGMQQGFISENPFKQGDPLIDAAIEETRLRVCTFEEEDLIYSVCVPPREHLRWVVTIAIDTFVRENELFSLMGSDINFAERFLIVREMNAKTLRERKVPLSDRAAAAFSLLRGDRSSDEWNTSPVFGMRSVKSAWYTALGKTEIKDLHFHDLRATGITRMLDAGVPAPIVMKYSGHDQFETFMKYVRTDLRIVQDAAAAMSSYYNRQKAQTAKGHLTLAKGREESEASSIEVRDVGDAVN
jgi:integrase